ncbi:hypothetical protein QU810_18685 [Klebsiella pneumoniae]|uniref:hypothetical protein n=1 Tax=Klebsiella pneumoniae TaxID=573 RepID=UPI0022314D00|nr:hypothetical protein [Klebsiella pneumoniae]MDM9245062.1 hypothetical protein [Klebsiella pneumoniae]
MTSKLTREWLQEAISDIQTRRDNGSVSWDDERENVLQALELALAAMDSEPNRNPVLAYADSYRDMAKQGVESVQIWSVITDLERNIAPLYRHEQPAQRLESAGWQFKSVNGDWLGLIDEHGKNQAVHEGCEVREVFAMTDEFDCFSATSSRSWLDPTPLTADLQTRALVMWIKRLSLALRSASPDNKLPKAAMGYLQKNGLISIADCLRGNNEESPA